jgi:hypothetical protein
MQTLMTIETQEITLNDLANMVQRGFLEVRTDMKSMENRLDARIDSLDTRIDSLEHSMNSRFSSLQGQMDNIYLNYALRKKK